MIPFGDNLVQSSPLRGSIDIWAVPNLTERDRLASDGSLRVGGIARVEGDQYYLLDSVAPISWSDLGTSLGGGSLTGGGPVRVRDLTGQGGTVVSNRTFLDANNTVLEGATLTGDSVLVEIVSVFPQVRVNSGAIVSLPPSVDGGHYAGAVALTGLSTGDIFVESVFFDGSVSGRHIVPIVVETAPELLTLSFSGGYPGAQTELKAGDTFQLSGTTDVPADAIEVQATGAADAVQLLTFVEGTSFTVTVVIGDRGDVPQALAVTARARSSSGAFGALRATNELGGSVDGVDVVTLNNLAPSFVFGGVTYPVGQLALKGLEPAVVDVAVSDFDSVSYSTPTGQLAVAAPSTYLQLKPVTATASGAYNDSTPNFQVDATRAANGATSSFSTVVEIADVAPVLTVSQPAARLRSGGNDGTATPSYVITATSNQNLLAAPDVTPPVGGTFTGGGFAGGPKVWTRSLSVADADAKGSGAWTLASPATNRAGIAASIAGNQVLGGFLPRTLTFGPFATNAQFNVAVSDFAKVQAGIFTATNAASLRQPIGTSPPVVNGYTIDAIGVSPTTLTWLDTVAASTNSSGTAQLVDLEETV